MTTPDRFAISSSFPTCKLKAWRQYLATSSLRNL
jgi:hypothetical protein